MGWWLGAIDKSLWAVSCSHSLGDQLVREFSKDAFPCPLPLPPPPVPDPSLSPHGVNDFGGLKDSGSPPSSS